MTTRSIRDRMARVGAQLWSTLALPLVAIVLAVLAGALVIIVTSWLVPGHPFDPSLPVTAYSALFEGSLGSDNGRIETLVQASPLLLAGLGIGLGFKGGLFNIGAQGQFLMGAVASVAAAGLVQDSGPLIAITVALLAGCLVGAAWGFVPGLLKAVSGAHEVVTTIMLNYVALSTLSWLVAGPLRLPRSPQPVTADVGAAALPVLIGRDGHLGIVIAFLAVPVIWFLLHRTTTGFEIRAVGANPDAARYAGMKPRRIVVLTMSLAGLLAGLAGSGNILGLNHQMTATFSTTVGFDAITVALLGGSNPIGIMFAAILFGAMRAGAALMQIKAGVPVELVDVVQSIILLFLVASVVFRHLFRLQGAKPAIPSGGSIVTATYGNATER